MEKQNFEKEKGNKESCWYKFIQGWIWFIMALTIFMFVVVTIDRCTFHNAVYKKAKTEVIKEIRKGIPVDTLCFSSDSSVVTICIRDTSEIPGNNFEKQLEFLEKSDNLLSSNSLTYLVTLIVALLAALLIFRVEADETSKEKIRKLRKEAQVLKDELSQLKEKSEDEIKQLKETSEDEIRKLKAKSEDEIKKLKEETDNKITQLNTTTGEKISSYHNHIKIYNGYLTTIESIYSLAIMISNTTAALSPLKSDEENENIATEVGGNLCSRLELLYDKIKQDIKIDHLTPEEKDILFTYLDDAQSALDSSKRSANGSNKENLMNYIDKNINSVKNIKKIIDNVDENKA